MTASSGGGYGYDPFTGGYQQTGRSTASDEDSYQTAAYNYIRFRRWQEALNALQNSQNRNARWEMARFFSAFFRIRCSRGAMMLKLIFMGWKFSTLSSLIYSPSAPMAVVLGNSGKGLPCAFAAMATAAK